MKKMKKIILALSLFLYNQIGFSQGFNNESSCGIMLPEGASKKEDTLPLFLFDSDSIDFIIPVVFHVFHSGGPENISSDVILSALDKLNKAFNRQNSDTLNIPIPFLLLRGNPKIEFRLARLDPLGNCTDGINRVFVPGTYASNQLGFNNVIEWNPEKYLNIYVTKHITNSSSYLGISGQSSIPNIEGGGNSGGFMNDDQVKVWYDPLDPTDQSASIFGYTLTHEVGHWLGLLHTFEGGCSGVGDKVNDTPKQATSNELQCPQFPNISCQNEPNGDNYNNFMSYSICKNMFTFGQVNRMQSALNTYPRRILIQSDSNLIATGVQDGPPLPNCPFPPNADFGMGNYAGLNCTGYGIRFNDASSFNPTSWHWSFEGGIPTNSSEKTPIISYPDTGTFNVMLVVSNNYGSDTISKIINIAYKDLSYGSPFLEDFENNNFNSNISKFYVPNIGSVSIWNLVSNVGFSGNHSMYLPHTLTFNTSFTTNTFDLELSGSGSHKLIFKVAHARDTSINYNDPGDSRLIVHWKRPCTGSRTDVNPIYSSGLPFDNSLIILPDDSLITVKVNQFSGQFIPNNSQWKDISIELPDTLFGKIQLVFNWYKNSSTNSAWFKGVYIDDIQLNTTLASTNEMKNSNWDWNIYPNPSAGTINYSIENLLLGSKLEIYGIEGKNMFYQDVLYSKGNIDISNFPVGIYFVRLVQNGEFNYKKIIKIN